MPGSRKLTVRVEALARVEGEGALHLRVHNGQVRELRLEIYEPPRFFEAFLRGRRLEEAPDITARICGICPVAYQMSACNALESLLDLSVGRPPPGLAVAALLRGMDRKPCPPHVSAAPAGLPGL
jgi:coenzyme F420-reducing hydrogenase alpha subunit